MPAVSLASSARVEVGEVLERGVVRGVAVMNASRAVWSGSGTSIVATCGLPVSRSLSRSFSSIMHERHVQALDVRTHRPVQHRHELRRGLQVEAPGLARGKHVRRLVDDHRQAQPLVFGRHDVVADEPIEDRDRGGGILRQGAEVADLLVGERDHVLEPLLVAAGERAQPAPQVVVEDQRPAAEQLLGEKLGEHAVPRVIVRRRRCGRGRRCCRAARTPRSSPRSRGRPAARPTPGTTRQVPGRRSLGEGGRRTFGGGIRLHSAAPRAGRIRGSAGGSSS